MAQKTKANSPPNSTDLDGWRLAIQDGRYREFRLEDIVAAIQDLGPCADSDVIRPLASHLSQALMRILVKYVRPGRSSRGIAIVENTHDQIIESVFQPQSADGKGLREAFVFRVQCRAKDAINREDRQPAVESDFPKSPAATESESDHSGTETPLDAAATDPSDWLEQWFSIKHLLERLIPHKRKRLAFHLFVEGVRRKSTKGCSKR